MRAGPAGCVGTLHESELSDVAGKEETEPCKSHTCISLLELM